MRRFRVPTIPSMGISPSKSSEQELETLNSAVFADAEDEPPPPPSRPSAPYLPMSKIQRAGDEIDRYADANSENMLSIERDQSVLKTLSFSANGENPSTTTQLSKVAPLTSLQERSAGDYKQKGEVSFSTPNNEILSGQNSIRSTVQGAAEPDPATNRNCEETSSGVISFFLRRRSRINSHPGTSDRKEDSRQTETHNLSGTLLKKEASAATPPRKIFQRAFEVVGRFQSRARERVLPCFRRALKATEEGLAYLVFAVFTFLRQILSMPYLLIKKQREHRKIERREDHKSQDAEGLEVRNNDDTAKSTEPESGAEPLAPAVLETEDTGAPAHDLQNENDSIGYKSDQDTRRSEDESDLHILSSKTTEDSMTKTPGISSLKNDSGLSQPLVAQDAEERTEEPRRLSLHSLQIQNAEGASGSLHVPGRTSNIQGVLDSKNGSSSETSSAGLRQNQDGGDDFMRDIDQERVRFELRDSEIWLSPLQALYPLDKGVTSNAEDRGREQHVTKNSEVSPDGSPAYPRRRPLSMELKESPNPPARKRSSRGHTGKLKTDVRMMKDSIFRAFGRNKVEPETRFASPRSAQKTHALIADVLVKEHGCNVAVKRSGPLKLRCEKAFTGERRLRVRLAFQAMDTFSCNVVVCRAREDDLQVATTDYVAFVADVQRSFLNATSEGMI